MVISLLLICVVMFAVSASFAADENVTLGEVDDEIAIDDNVLSVEEDTDALSVDDESSEIVSASATVTNDTFFDYFDSSGALTSDAEELVFEGDFSSLGISQIMIAKDSPVKFIGKNATFTNVQFMIMQSDVTINGLNILTDSDNQHTRLIWIGTDDYLDNITLSNNKITFIGPKDGEGFAIYAGSDDDMGFYSISDLQIINNNITYVGNTDGDKSRKNNVIRVSGDDMDEVSDSITVQGNRFNVTMPSVKIPRGYFDEPLPVSEAIVFYYCDDVKFIDNRIDLKYNNISGSPTDTINIISAYANSMYMHTSSKVIIKDNEINALGHSFTYGVFISAENFEISNNKFNLSSDIYDVHGINIEGPSSNGIVDNNTFLLQAPTTSENKYSVGAAYGIYSEQNFGAIRNVTYKNNTLDLNGYLACGMEIRHADAYIFNNTIAANGNYTYGIAGSFLPTGFDSYVEDNIIYTLGSNNGTAFTGDPILPANSMGITVLGSCEVKNNKIVSTSVGINALEDSVKSTIILNNNNVDVVANSGKVDNHAIVADKIDDLTIVNNTVVYSGMVDYQFEITGSYEYDGYTYYIYDTSKNAKAYGVYVKNSNVVIKNNTFEIAIPTFSVNWGATREAFSEGIVLVGCDDLRFENNNVTIKTNGGSSGDTIYGIDVLNSARPHIENNNITLIGKGYSYGIIINDALFLIADNNITVTSDNYACGIDVEGAASGVIDENVISVEASESAYAIYTGMTSGDVDVIIVNNEVEAKAYYVVALEIAAKTALIENNNVYADGNHTIGVGTKVSKVTIKDNAINAFASNEGNNYVWDGMGTLNSAIKVIEGNATIFNNTIASNAIGINVDSTNDNVTIEKNDIVVNANSGKVDNYAIVAEDIDELSIFDNEILFNGLVDYQFAVVGSYEYEGYTYDIYDTSNNTKAYGVYIKKSNVKIKNNTFEIAIPTFSVNWGATRESFSEGIVLVGCDDLVFENNNVTIQTNGGSSWNSVYGIDVLDSANATVKDNNITFNGIGYAYVLSINDEGFNIEGNNIFALSDKYVCAIDVEGTAQGDIFNNTIEAYAKDSVYPIYSGMNGMPVNVNIIDNEIYGQGYYVVGIEIAGQKVLIENNTLVVEGNHTIGIASEVYALKLNNNTIVAAASNEGNDKVYDYMGTENVGVLVYKGNAWISNNKIGSNAIGIKINPVSELDYITNNSIVVFATSGKVNNYAIVADNITALGILNNTVRFYGLVDNQFEIIGYYDPDTMYYPIYDTANNTRSYAVFIKNSNVGIENNTFQIAIPTFAVNWGVTREAFSEGIVLVGCDDLEFTKNNVTITANGGSSWDSIYGIDILNSANPIIEDNNITLNGKGYSYGIIINDETFDINENYIGVTSDNYACGIDVEGKATGSIVDNAIYVSAAESAYPIYTGMTSGEVNVDIYDNDIVGKAYYVVGLEISANNTEILGNDIRVEGNHTIGIGVYVEKAIIEDNTVISQASNIGNKPVWDNMGTNTTGIKVAKGNFSMDENTVLTTGDYAINTGDNNGTITDSELLSNNGAGDDAIVGSGNVTSIGNLATLNPYLKVVIFANDLTKVEGSADKFVVKVFDENGHPVGNKTVTLVVNNTVYTATSDSQGVATFDANFAPGEYVATIMFSDDTLQYGSKSITNVIVVTAKPVTPTPTPVAKKTVKITAKKKTFKVKTKTKKYTITLKANNKAVKGLKVTLKVKGKTYKATTNAKGKATFKIKNLKKKGKYTAKITFKATALYKAANKSVKITVKK